MPAAATIRLRRGEESPTPAIDRGAAISGQLTADSEACRLVTCNRCSGGQIYNLHGIQKYT